MHNIMQVVLFAGLAGLLGSGLGGLISIFLLKRPSERITCWMLSFAAGVMTSIVCFSLIPESFALTNATTTVIGLTLGIVVMLILNRLVDKIHETRAEKLNIHHTHAELFHEGEIIRNHKKMLRSGILMFIAIGLHNLPEGLAIGAASSHDLNLGILLAIMIALHNIPEGMAIATPLLAGGINRWKVLFLTIIAEPLTILGGVAGLLIGGISEFSIAVSLSAAGGAMLYVVFGEIIPQSIVMTRSRTATIVTMFGIIVGFLLAQI